MSGAKDTYAWRGIQRQQSSTDDFQERLFMIESVLSSISTATVVKVMRAPYDNNGNAITPGSASNIGYIDVQPLVNQLDGYGNATPHGTVYHLSYHRYGGGNGAFIADPAVGDIGKMVVADRDTSAVKATNAQANPGSHRVFDKADGTYMGYTQGAAPTQYVACTNNGIEVTTSKSFIIHPVIVMAPNLPQADPHKLGQLWVDPAAQYVVKQSQG
jgi:hypothetical protein